VTALLPILALFADIGKPLWLNIRNLTYDFLNFVSISCFMSDEDRVSMVPSPKTKTETETQGFQDQNYDQDSEVQDQDRDQDL